MNRSFRYFPDDKLYTIPELETRIQFQYLSTNGFESSQDQEDILKRGLAELEHNAIRAESLELGNKLKPIIESGYIPEVSIHWINESVGHGLFLEEDLECGSYVGEYTGIVRKNDLRRYFTPLNNYLYEYPVPDSIGRSFVIDATQGNLTRFINHSEKPNLKPIHVFYDGYFHLIFLTLCPIQKGTQLCYQYGQTYWHIREKPMALTQ